MADPTFYYDFSSPYSYFSAHRVDAVMPVTVRWQPILFGALIIDIGKEPWSWEDTPARDERMRECEQRAADLGLPLKWPEGWPRQTYSVLVLRAALAAEDLGRLREFSLAAFRYGLGEGQDLSDPKVVGAIAGDVGLDAETVLMAAQDPKIKQRLRDVTDAARELGVTGVPTVAAAGELFWGDDRLAQAVAALRT
ncbi:MAG: 2-hydroxychromene-2-carboxylate isomerase [Thermoleophilaceae bacterium]|nr:2-hydroxychromene-2-carboxylate isomerase [Thermoleophilaceae bacterium]